MTMRRDFLALTAAAVVAKTVLPAKAKGAQLALPSPDAAVLAACAEFDAIERHVNSLYPSGTNPIEDDDERGEAIEPLWEAQGPVLDQVCGLRAHTLEGLQARARTIVLENMDLNPAVDAMGGCTNDRLMAALLRDLLAMGSNAG